MQTHSLITFLISIIGTKFNEDLYLKNRTMIFFISFNGIYFVLSSIAICPLIKFYYSQSKKKASKNIDFSSFEERKGVRLLNNSEDETFV